MIDATLGHIPYFSGSFRDGRFVQTVLIKDMSHCYDIFGLHHVYVGCHTRAYPSNFAFTIFRSDVQTSSSTYQAFRLSLHMDQTFRLRLLCIKCSDFAFIWIGCSDFICITFTSSADQTFKLRLLHIRRSDFAFIWIRCSDFIYIIFVSIVVRCSDFFFCISGVQTSPLYGSDVQTSSVSHFLAPQLDVQTSSSAYQAFRLCLHMDKMFRLHLYHIF